MSTEESMAVAPFSEGPAAGIYVHIPFCQRKCRYCDFFSVTDRSGLPDFVDAVVTEIRKADVPVPPADTLYFGGGTPSLLSPAQTERIIDAVAHRFSLQAHSEITLEANPNSASFSVLKDFSAAGINRINIGVQSFKDSQLSFLGRLHTAQEAAVSLVSARQAGFSNIGLDLIYGLPGQTPALLREELDRALSFEPDHISCYMLTLEPHTPLDIERRRGRWRPLDEDSAAGLFDVTHEHLAASGYCAYEISNFARNCGRRSRHNLKYWNFSPYIGFGPSAHSCRYPNRWWNEPDLEKYMHAIGSGNTAVSGAEELSPEQQVIEAVFLRLRTTPGLDITWFNHRYDTDFHRLFSDAAAPFVRSGWMELTKDACRLTRSGFRFHDGICQAMVDSL